MNKNYHYDNNIDFCLLPPTNITKNEVEDFTNKMSNLLHKQNIKFNTCKELTYIYLKQ